MVFLLDPQHRSRLDGAVRMQLTISGSAAPASYEVSHPPSVTHRLTVDVPTIWWAQAQPAEPANPLRVGRGHHVAWSQQIAAGQQTLRTSSCLTLLHVGVAARPLLPGCTSPQKGPASCRDTGCWMSTRKRGTTRGCVSREMSSLELLSFRTQAGVSSWS